MHIVTHLSSTAVLEQFGPGGSPRGSTRDSYAWFEDLLGASVAMRQVFCLLERVAASDATVLVTGESGTGKELVARALHRRSRRRRAPFVAVNCAALPESLLESELFGHVRGAFTDAKSSRTGLLCRADGGSLFLDEIGEMPWGMQAKLLRALQSRCVRPVGGDQEIRFDARIMAATNGNIDLAVENGSFRQDLFFRLNVIQIDLPPLRERDQDVLLLAQHLLDRSPEAAEKGVRAFSADAEQKMLAYRWPGNVRELENCVERAIVLAKGPEVLADDLPHRVAQARPGVALSGASEPPLLLPLAEVEKRHILRVLEAVGGQRTAAARVLGLDRKTLQRKLERWGRQER